MKEKFSSPQVITDVQLKVQRIGNHYDGDKVNKACSELRKALKCSWWRLHFLKVVPYDSQVFRRAKESTVNHHKISIKRFLQLKKFYCQKCQTVYYKE